MDQIDPSAAIAICREFRIISTLDALSGAFCCVDPGPNEGNCQLAGDRVIGVV